MQRSVVEEFYAELEATDEKFIRKKHREGGYAGWKLKHVKQFLAERDAAKAEKHTSRTAFWTMVAGGCAVLTLIATVFTAFHHSN